MALPHIRFVHTGFPPAQRFAGYVGFTPGTICSVLLQPSHHAEPEVELNDTHLMG